MRKKTILAIFVILLVAIVPANNVLAEPVIEHPFDNSALLMISANMRLDGNVTSAQGVNSQHLLAPSLQASDGNEIDALIDLYSAQIAKLRASDTYSEGQEAALIAQLEAKVQALNQQAQALNAKRAPIQPRGGLGRALRWAAGRINQGVKGVGRVTGKLVGAVMDGTGEIVEFAIEDVAPQVLKEALQSGVPINAALVRRITRELLINRVSDAILRNQQRRAGQLPPVEVEEVDDLMEAFEEDEKTESIQEGAAPQDVPEPTQAAEAQVVTYTFTLADHTGVENYLFPGDFGTRLTDKACWAGGQILDSVDVVLQFDLEAMTLSGTVRGETHEVEYSFDQLLMLDGTGGFEATFSDIPATPYGENAWKFSGWGTADVNYGGTLGCDNYDAEAQDYVYFTLEDQLSLTDVPAEVHLVVSLAGEEPAVDLLCSNPDNDLGLNFIVQFQTNQAIDLPAP